LDVGHDEVEARRRLPRAAREREASGV